MTNEACKDCRFCVVAVENDKPSETTGYCYRYPPTLVTPNQSSFPVVRLDWWCGEFVISPAAITKAATPRRKPR